MGWGRVKFLPEGEPHWCLSRNTGVDGRMVSVIIALFRAEVGSPSFSPCNAAPGSSIIPLYEPGISSQLQNPGSSLELGFQKPLHCITIQL